MPAIGPFRLIRHLGEGRSGNVWLAEDAAHRRQVALKLFNDPAGCEAERSVLEQLDHPGIVRLLDAGSTATQAWLALEFVAGLSLTVFSRQQKLDCKERLELLLQAIQAIAYASGKGIVHGDITPKHLLVARRGNAATIKLIDFSGLRCGGGVGYRSPEQIASGEADFRSDIYSLGRVMFELLAGPHTIGQGLESIVRRCLQIEPAKRYSTASALTDDLGRWLTGAAVLAGVG